jgi:serine/threonine protein kinase
MLSPGTLLGGRYRIETLVGEGGMGAVYEAVQQDLDRRVALKILHEHFTEDVELRGRFQREARVVAMLGHPNVVQISDFQAREGEPPFFVMELLHGENLRDLLKRTRMLPPERVAYIAVQVLSALEAAHRANVVHRDIKPDNIFLERTDVQADIVKVLDFGVAKLLGHEEGMKLTRSGLVVGTLSYMAPEQALGDPLDGRADLYSLAATMYLALTGRKPFDGATTAALLKKIMDEVPLSASKLRPEIPEKLSAVFDRALAKRPDDRFASAADMARALAPFAKPTPLDSPLSAATTLRTPDTIPESLPPRTTPLPLQPMQFSYQLPPPTIQMMPLPTPMRPPPRKSSAAPIVIGVMVACAFIVLACALVILALRR